MYKIRWNFGQFYEQSINSVANVLHLRIAEHLKQNPNDWISQFNLAMEFIGDISPNYRDLLLQGHNTPARQKELIEEIARDGFYIQILPFQENISPALIKFLIVKYNVPKGPITISVRNREGEWEQRLTKKAMRIGSIYWILLYKQPHQRSSGVGYVNQYQSPVRPNSLAKLQSPISLTPIRLGEDEIRNLIMTSGSDVAARILGMYANSPKAREMLTEHLLLAEKPSQLKQLPISTEEIVKTNSIMGVVQHTFAVAGVDIMPENDGSFESYEFELPTDAKK